MLTNDGLLYLSKIGADLRTGEVAEVLGMTPGEVRQLAMLTDGIQPVPNPHSRQRRWLASDVLAYLNKHGRRDGAMPPAQGGASVAPPA